MALTAGRNTPELAEGGRVLILPVAAGKVIYDGSLVALDASGNAKPAEKAANLKAAGRAEEYADNTGGAAGAVTVRVRRGVFVWDNTATAEDKVTSAHILQNCYIEDDCTVTMDSETNSAAGKVIAVTDDGIAVETL